MRGNIHPDCAAQTARGNDQDSAIVTLMVKKLRASFYCFGLILEPKVHSRYFLLSECSVNEWLVLYR